MLAVCVTAGYADFVVEPGPDSSFLATVLEKSSAVADLDEVDIVSNLVELASRQTPANSFEGVGDIYNTTLVFDSFDGC